MTNIPNRDEQHGGMEAVGHWEDVAGYAHAAMRGRQK